MNNIKIILLIGRTGRGKSTLSNVLLNKDGNFKEVFKESAGSVSETREIQFEEFDPEKEKLENLLNKLNQEEDFTSKQNNLDKEDKQILQETLKEHIQNREGVKYCIIDTPGIGDTQLPTEKILDIIAEAVYLAKDDLNQVFFVTNGRFDQFEMATYNLLRTIIFDQNVAEHTTIVRTNFPNFDEEEDCKEDIDSMIKKCKELVEIINSCNKVIHVDNPSMQIKDTRKLDINKEKRNDSREIILDHLLEKCQKIYEPPKLQELSLEIVDYMESKIRLKKELKSLLESKKAKTTEVIDQQVSGVKIVENKLENASTEGNKVESILGKEEQTFNNQNFMIQGSVVDIEVKIKKLEDEKAKLKKEIAEKEEIIRQKVLKHIFNNHDEVAKVKGGSIFIDKISGDKVNWEKISEEFINNEELVRRWLSQGFNYQRVQKWMGVLGGNFNPEDDTFFIAWLRDDKKITAEKVLGYSFEQLKIEYFGQLGKEVDIYSSYNQKLRKKETSQEKKTVYSVNAQEYLDKNYPTKKVRENVAELNISNQNLEGELDLSDFINLNVLNLEENKITNLDLTGCHKLKELNCSSNLLTNLDFLNNLNPQRLEKLGLFSNNFPTQDLDIFAPFQELKLLKIGMNKFVGSLKPLRNMSKLEALEVDGTDISHGLEYLPESVKVFHCSAIRSEARVIDIWEELQSFGGDIKKWREVKLEKKLPLLVSSLLPTQLVNKIKPKNKLRENHDIREFNYDKLYFNFWGKNELSSSEKLPTKLYNIKEKRVEETKNNPNIKNYAILSYIWGNPNESRNKLSEEQKKELDDTTIDIGYENSDLLTRLGYKSWKKAIQTCKLLGINYIWIDQLCINQKDNKDKEQQVPKMRQYFSNATITPISINAELGDISNVDMIDVLKKIINSEWFTRSWTYQDGWLSKHTIFMFDDKLIDGRVMAGIWTLNQPSYVDGGKYDSRAEFNKGTKKIATPVGWVYYRDGYTSEDRVSFSLSQNLRAIKKRGRSIPIDGIYSILGLLPYGEHVKVKYNKDNKYTQEELNQTLYEVMKVAMGYREKIEPTDYILSKYSEETIKETLPDGRLVIEYWERNGYGEPLDWHGASNITPGLCWMPQIYEDGSTSVVGGINVRCNDVGNIFEEERGIKLLSANYIIHKVDSHIQKLEEGFEIEGGLYQKEVEVKPENNEPIQISLLGTQSTLELVQENKIIVVPNKEEWISKKPFVLLVEDTGETSGKYNHPVYHRLGLVELGSGKRLKGGNEKEIIIGVDNLQIEPQHQSQIQIPPK